MADDTKKSTSGAAGGTPNGNRASRATIPSPPPPPAPGSIPELPPLPDADPPFEAMKALPQPLRKEYLQAKLVYSQAYGKFQAAQADAARAYAKAYRDWAAARSNYDKAVADRKDAFEEARQALAAVNALTAAPAASGADAASAAPLDADALADPDAAKKAIDRLQAAVDAFKAAVQKIAAADAGVQTALAALAKLSDTADPDPDKWTPSRDNQRLATDQYILDVATAQTDLDAAFDLLQVKQTELRGRIGTSAPAATARAA